MSSSPVDTERELLRRFTTGDASAFAQLVHTYKSQIYGYVCRSGVPMGVRDDLFQDIFLRVSQAAGRFDFERPFKPWLFAIAVNTVRSHFRKPQLAMVDAVAAEVEDGGPRGDQILAAQETASWLDTAIAALPGPQRDVLILVCIQRMDRQEVARTLDIPLETVKTLLRRGRLTLAKQLASRTARTEHEYRERAL
ncbi:MAG: RNA polymerase sigma factor [Kofleriaceae bacterium]|nr:RNA polymerase sigma factor [Kofleriaceae bacterium]